MVRIVIFSDVHINHPPSSLQYCIFFVKSDISKLWVEISKNERSYSRKKKITVKMDNIQNKGGHKNKQSKKKYVSN